MSPRPSTGNATPPAAAWPLQRQEVKSADGTAICAYWSPEAQLPADAPTVVLAADLAEAVPDVWRPQVEYLRDVRFVAWEYRGTRHAAAAPPTKRYDVEAHLEDLCAVLMEAGLAPDAPFMIMGSGVGVRIALEATLALPQRVKGLVLLGGAAGWRYELLCRASLLAATVAHRLVGPSGKEAGRHQVALLAAVTHGVDRVMQLAEMSLVERTRNEAAEPVRALHAIATCLRTLGTKQMLEQAGRISQPALVLCGEADPRMPAALAHQLARRLTRSRVRIVPRTSSRLAADFPDLVNLEVERFFAELSESRT